MIAASQLLRWNLRNSNRFTVLAAALSFLATERNVSSDLVWDQHTTLAKLHQAKRGACCANVQRTRDTQIQSSSVASASTWMPSWQILIFYAEESMSRKVRNDLQRKNSESMPRVLKRGPEAGKSKVAEREMTCINPMVGPLISC